MRSSLPLEIRLARRRANRGLVRAIRANVVAPPTSRDLIGPVLLTPADPPGICRWCGDPTRAKGIRWHRTCVSAYTAARGRGPYTQRGYPVIDRPPCPCGRSGWSGDELDHRLALGIVIREPTPWRIVRAWSLDNLQWLCHECHAAKTAHDLAIMRAQTRAKALGRDFAAGGCPGPAVRPLRRSLFGGLVRA